MLAVKGFKPGLVATLGKGVYQFHPGKNVTQEAHCARTGFHCCENPMDCLGYYPWDGKNEFWAVYAGGDLDEDCVNTRISCTEMTLIRRLSEDDFLLLYANWFFNHPAQQLSDFHKGPFHVSHTAGGSLSGKLGEWLCFLEVNEDNRTCIADQVDGKRILPDRKYTAKDLEALE